MRVGFLRVRWSGVTARRAWLVSEHAFDVFAERSIAQVHVHRRALRSQQPWFANELMVCKRTHGLQTNHDSQNETGSGDRWPIRDRQRVTFREHACPPPSWPEAQPSVLELVARRALRRRHPTLPPARFGTAARHSRRAGASGFVRCPSGAEILGRAGFVRCNAAQSPLFPTQKSAEICRRCALLRRLLE